MLSAWPSPPGHRVWSDWPLTAPAGAAPVAGPQPPGGAAAAVLPVWIPVGSGPGQRSAAW